jgi:transposase-like protein
MAADVKVPATLMEAIQYFSDPLTCIQFFAKLRWESGEAVCPRCQSRHTSFLSTRLMWKCLDCKKQFSIKVGTIFEDSAIGLDKWLCAMFLIANCKNGVSSYEISRDIHVTQRTAWFMLQRIRHAMHTGTFSKLSGEIEVDETFIGGKTRNMHKRKREEKIGGWVRVEPFHLFRYLDEQAFRFDARHTTDADRFLQLCLNVTGRRLTWNELTGKGEASRPDREGGNALQ